MTKLLDRSIAQQRETRSFWDTGFNHELSPQQFSVFFTRHLLLAQGFPGCFVHHAVSRQTLKLLKVLDSRSRASAKNAVDPAGS